MGRPGFEGEETGARLSPRDAGGGVAALPAPPGSDERWKRVATALRRHGQRPEALIEGMHAVQQSFGSLEPGSLHYLAEALGVPLSRVYGVATFYHLFTMEPPGAHACLVCTGTACHLDGAPAILRALADAHGVAAGETSRDRELSVGVARCIGTCSLSPAVVVDGEVLAHATPEGVLERVAPFFRTHEGPAQ